MTLRPLYRLGFLVEILPEFRAIDSLVVRDFYHRYRLMNTRSAPLNICRTWVSPTIPGHSLHAFGEQWIGATF